MSKKMLKRSLALGALMAFVITGQAWAGDAVDFSKEWPSGIEGGEIDGKNGPYFGDTGTTIIDVIHNDKFESWYDFKDKPCGLEKRYYPGTQKLEGDFTLEAGDKGVKFNGYTDPSITSDDNNPNAYSSYLNSDLNGYELTINYTGTYSAIYANGRSNGGLSYDGTEKVNSEWGYVYKHIYTNLEKLPLDLPGFNIRNGNLVIKSSNIGIHGHGSIDVNTLKITSTNDAIKSLLEGNEKESHNLAIDAKIIELVVGTNGNAIQVNNALDINSEVLDIKNIKEAEYKRAIRVYNATANITAGTLNISGANGSSKVDANGILNLKADKGSINNNFEAAYDSDNIDGITGAGTVNLTFGSGVILEGKVTTDMDNGAASNITLNGATWKVTGDSNITTLAGNGGIIAIKDGVTGVTVTNDNATNLTVQKADATADEYTVETAQVALSELNNVVKTTTGDAVADVVAIAEGNIVGAYVLDENGKAVEAVNTTNQAIGEAAVALKSHWRAHMNDMNKRMGELRMANGETGVWTRMVRGETEYQGAKAQYNQYQLGYDEKLSTDKRWTVGAAVTFAEGEGSFGKGTTEDDSTAFAIYGSKLNNDGTFVDLIARYARMESDVTSYTGQAADYSTNGYSVSAEFGKRIQQGNGLWIEPQVELTYGSVDSAEYMLDGKNVQVGDMDSLIGRVGFRLGKDIEKGNVYARASYLYDFDGETETTFGKAGLTRTIEEDLGGGWWEVGVGANINLSKATYIYADVEKTFGGEVDTNWQWNLGVRYSF